MTCNLADSNHQKIGRKGIDDNISKIKSVRVWSLNNAHLLLKFPKCAEKIAHILLHHQLQPGPLIRSRIDPCF